MENWIFFMNNKCSRRVLLMIAETQYYLAISSSSHLDWAFNIVKCVVDCFMQKNNKTVEK